MIQLAVGRVELRVSKGVVSTRISFFFVVQRFVQIYDLLSLLRFLVRRTLGGSAALKNFRIFVRNLLIFAKIADFFQKFANFLKI